MPPLRLSNAKQRLFPPEEAPRYSSCQGGFDASGGFPSRSAKPLLILCSSYAALARGVRHSPVKLIPFSRTD